MWEYPFTDIQGGRLSRKQWVALLALFAFLHVAGIQAAMYIGTFEAEPNHDHVEYMFDVLAQGYPTPTHSMPGYAYYMALKWKSTEAFGYPYWYAKYFIDIVPVLLAGILSVLLGQALTQNRLLAVCSGIGLLSAPIFLLGIGHDGPLILFMPFFLLSLWFLVRGLQRKGKGRVFLVAIAGAAMGLATLVRGNPQFIIVVVAVFIYWVLRKENAQGWRRQATLLTIVFLVMQMLAITPWTIVQRGFGHDGVGYPSLYMSYYWGVKRQADSQIGRWLNEHYDEPDRSFEGVIDFHLKWLKEEPTALVELYALKFVRAWYISESGKWDMAILFVHLPFWILAILGWWQWRRNIRKDPARLLILLIIGYMWIVSAIIGSIARYSAPLYGFIGLMAGVWILMLFRRYLPASWCAMNALPEPSSRTA